jgi:hypothetical protein
MAHLPVDPTPMRSPEPSRLTVLLRIAVLCLPCAFWGVAAGIPPEHPDQAAKGRALILLWAGQSGSAFLLARRLGRQRWTWAASALATFTLAPAALAFLGPRGVTARTAHVFRCDRCGAVTAAPAGARVDAVGVCKGCGWQAR